LKKRWYMVPVAAGLLALAVTGGAIFAQGNSGGPGGFRHQEFVARVAEILGLDEATVQDAFSQAHQEQQDAALQSKLADLVASEKLTQQAADAIYQWYQARPVTDLPLRGFMLRSDRAVQQSLARMVADERLTQAEADAVMAWYQDKPEALSELSGDQGRFDRRFDRGFRGRRFHHGPQKRDNGAATDTRIGDDSAS